MTSIGRVANGVAADRRDRAGAVMCVKLWFGIHPPRHGRCGISPLPRLPPCLVGLWLQTRRVRRRSAAGGIARALEAFEAAVFRLAHDPNPPLDDPGRPRTWHVRGTRHAECDANDRAILALATARGPNDRRNPARRPTAVALAVSGIRELYAARDCARSAGSFCSAPFGTRRRARRMKRLGYRREEGYAVDELMMWLLCGLRDAACNTAEGGGGADFALRRAQLGGRTGRRTSMDDLGHV